MRKDRRTKAQRWMAGADAEMRCCNAQNIRRQQDTAGSCGRQRSATVSDWNPANAMTEDNVTAAVTSVSHRRPWSEDLLGNAHRCSRQSIADSHSAQPASPYYIHTVARLALLHSRDRRSHEHYVSRPNTPRLPHVRFGGRVDVHVSVEVQPDMQHTKYVCVGTRDTHSAV